MSSTKTKKKKTASLQIPGLIVERVSLEKLKLDDENVRVHDIRNLAAIRGSLEQFGQVEPLVVQRSTHKVIGGNGRLISMRELGKKDCEVVFVDLNDLEATALSITLNRTAELADWDFETLATVIREIKENDKFKLDRLGWADDELAPLLETEWVPPQRDDDGAPAIGVSINVTEEEHKSIMEAITILRNREDDKKISEGRCIELIVAEWLS